jgi:hypothetical protein
VTKKGWLEEDRPSFTGLLRWLLGDQLGGTLANYYSAVAHGTQLGLVSAVMAVEADPALVGPGRAVLGVSANDVNLALSASAMALIRCLDSERVLMGRNWSRWAATQSQALGLVGNLVSGILAAQLPHAAGQID